MIEQERVDRNILHLMYTVGCSSSSSLNTGFPLWVKPAAYILLWGHLTLWLTSTDVV